MLKLKKYTTRDALRAAATKGCLEAVRFFVEEGVDKDAADKEGNTPVMLASQNNHLAIVQFLKDFKTDKTKSDMSLKNKTADTRDALRSAANKGCLEAVQFLVEEEVSQTDKDKEGRIPLLLAVQSGHDAIARYLVESMQEETTDKTESSWGNEALTIAARNGHLVIMHWLLEQGADKDKADRSGNTAFMWAAREGLLTSMQWLLEQGADKDKARNDGITPLMFAAEKGHLKVTQWLLEQGADVNKATKDGWTALHHAAYNNLSELVTCLMNWGADLTGKIVNGFWAGRLPINVTFDEAIRQLIRDEETRRNNHGYKRAVIPNPTDEERKRARLDRGEEEEEAQGQGQGQGQASANAVAEEDDGENDDSGSELEYD